MSDIKVGQIIREQLPTCGDCQNCKLVVWSNDASKSKVMRNASSINVSNNEKRYFIVNCAWLKYAVAEPLFIEKCEGKKGIKF